MIGIVGANALWSVFIRYRVVVPVLAFWGALFVRLKWITCPVSSYFLWRSGMKGTAGLALFFPLVVIFLPNAPAQVGVIQKMFMQCLGYTPTERAEIDPVI